MTNGCSRDICPTCEGIALAGHVVPSVDERARERQPIPPLGFWAEIRALIRWSLAKPVLRASARGGER